MDTYHLAVCEDDKVVRDAVVRLCGELLEEMEIPNEITAFSSAEELEQVLRTEKQRFDLLLLDIKMKRKSGMELAKELRGRKDRVSIIFLTGCEEYLREGYVVQPIDFLLKPIKREELKRALETDWQINHREKTIYIQKGNRNLQLKLDGVLYAEPDGKHGVCIFQQTGQLQFSMTLTELERLLPGDRFVRCHNSYLINMEHVQEFHTSWVIMDDGQRIPLGRRYYKECQEAFVSYVNR